MPDKTVERTPGKAAPPRRDKVTGSHAPVKTSSMESLLARQALADPATTSPTQLIALQHTAGNRAVTHLIQAKLTVGPAHDQFEQEADRVAQQVMNMPAPAQTPSTVQRQGEEEEIQTKPLAATITSVVQRQEEEEEIQTKSIQRQEDEEEIQTKPIAQRQPEEEELQMRPLAGPINSLVQRVGEDECEELKRSPEPSTTEAGFEAGADVEQQLEAQRDGGSPLPENVRTDMEGRFGADFSQVKIHANPDAARLSRAVQAQAFTQGAHVYFGENQYQPGSSSGKYLLAHELTHVIQQTGRGRSVHLQAKFDPPASRYVQRNLLDWLKKKFSKKPSISAPTGGHKMTPSEQGNVPSAKQLIDQKNLEEGVTELMQVGDVAEESAPERMGPRTLTSLLGDPVQMAELATRTTIPELNLMLKSNGVGFKKRLEVDFTYWDPVALSAINPDIQGATQDERDKAWRDKALLDLAKTRMATQDYLSLLPALRVFKKGVTAEDHKSHTKADDADKYIRTHLAAYVGEAVKAGKQVSGQVAVVDGADWDLAYVKVVGDDGGQDTTNAFVDHPPDGSPGRIWIHKNRGNAGTIIHEGIHKYSTDAVIKLSQPFNEGVTEYFTRKICAALPTPIARGNYQSNFLCAQKFAGIVGEAVLAKAYFDGDVAGMRKAFLATGRTRQQWFKFLKKTKSNEWAKATGVLDEPVTPVAPALSPEEILEGASLG